MLFCIISTFVWQIVIILLSCYESEASCGESYVGRNGQGVLKSYNYPFAYQNNLSCIYRIILSATNTSPKSICFKFHRFHLETSTPFCSFDFVQIDKIKYCGMGVWQYGLQPSNPEYNVWSESFCWTVKTQFLDISFTSDNSINGLGFYATYEIMSELQSKVVIPRNGSAPCIDTEWTCFNRKCISRDLLCNNVDDCGDDSDESYAHAECGETGLQFCDFNSNRSLTDSLCGLTASGWLRVSRGRSMLDDHTTGQKGHYMETVANLTTAQLTSDQVTLSRNQTYCLCFWHYVSHSAALRLYINRAMAPARPIWSRTYPPADIQWAQAEVSLQGPSAVQATFVADLASTAGLVAIDDISIIDGDCDGDDISCNFEGSFCGWTVADVDVLKALELQGKSAWTLASHGAFLTDHSSLDGSGQYLSLNKMARGEAGESSAQQGGEGVLVSRQVRLLGSHTVCVTLWYAIVGDDASVHVKTYDADGVVSSDHWSDDSTTDGLWIQTRLTLVSDGPFQLVLVGAVGDESEGSQVAVDEISLQLGDCASLISGPDHCPTDYHACPGVTGCVPINQTCQEDLTVGPLGEADAGSCAPMYFRCVSDLVCIHKEWVCDSFRDCADGSDEADILGCKRTPAVGNGSTAGPVLCTPDAFVCEDGVHCAVRCNGRKECASGNDETNCTALLIPPFGSRLPSTGCKEFQCISSSACVAQVKTCDGHADCPDASDESQLYASCAIKPAAIGLTLGSVVGIAVACACTLILIVVMICVLVRRRAKSTPRRRLHRTGDSSASGIAYLDDATTIDRHMAALNNMRTPMQNILQLPVYSQQDPNTDNAAYQSESLKQQHRAMPHDPPPPYDYGLQSVGGMGSSSTEADRTGYRPASQYSPRRVADNNKIANSSIEECPLSNGMQSEHAAESSRLISPNYSNVNINPPRSNSMIYRHTHMGSPNLLSLSPIPSTQAALQDTGYSPDWPVGMGSSSSPRSIPHDSASAYFSVTRPTSAGANQPINDVAGRKSDNRSSKRVILGTHALNTNRTMNRGNANNDTGTGVDHIYETLPHLMPDRGVARMSIDESAMNGQARYRSPGPVMAPMNEEGLIREQKASLEFSASPLLSAKPLWPASQELFSPMSERPLPDVPYNGSDHFQVRPVALVPGSSGSDVHAPVVLRQKRSTVARPTSWQRTEIPRAMYIPEDGPVADHQLQQPTGDQARKSHGAGIQQPVPRMSAGAAHGGYSLSRGVHGRQKLPTSASYHDSPLALRNPGDASNAARAWEPLTGSIHAVCSPVRQPPGNNQQQQQQLFDSDRYFRPIHPPGASPVVSTPQSMKSDSRLQGRESAGGRNRNSFVLANESGEFMPLSEV